MQKTSSILVTSAKVHSLCHFFPYPSHSTLSFYPQPTPLFLFPSPSHSPLPLTPTNFPAPPPNQLLTCWSCHPHAIERSELGHDVGNEHDVRWELLFDVLIRPRQQPPRVVQNQVANSIRMLNGVRGTQIPSEAVSKQDDLFQSYSLPPLLQVLHEHRFILVWVVGKLDSCAPGIAGKVDGVDAAGRMQVVVVLVELGNPTAETMHHHQRNGGLWGRGFRLEDDSVYVDVGSHRNMDVPEV